MKHVKLLELSLINFKGQNRTIEYHNSMTNILGDNGTGKSANFDGFAWLLFGKDQFDRKDYNILTVDPVTKQVINKVDSEVSAVIAIEDDNTGERETMSLKRILHQNWERPRGTEEQIYKGNETLCYINDVPMKVGDYQKRIAGIIDETVFKLITNPAYFLFSKEMTWQKQRMHLLEMAGTISDDEIAGRKQEYRDLLDRLSGKSFDEYRKTISARKKKLKEDLEQIQPRIDQTKRLTPEDGDFPAIGKEITRIEKEIREIDEALTNKAKASELHFAEIQKKQKKIGELRSLQQDIVNKAKETAKDDAFKKNEERRQTQRLLGVAYSDLTIARRDVTNLTEEINTLKRKIEAIKEKITSKRESWNILNEKQYQGESGCLICPVYKITCSDPEAQQLHENNGKAAIQTFNDQKIEKLQVIRAEGQELSKTLEGLESNLLTKKGELETAESNIKTCQDKHGELQKNFSETTEANPEEVIPENIEEWAELETQITAIQSEIDTNELPADDNTGQIEKKRQLNAERDRLKLRFADKDKIEKDKKEIADLEAKGKDLSQQIADIEKDEFTMAAFNKVRIDECNQRVNGLFSIVDFQLYDKTLEGNESEACIPKNKKGVYISSTNTAEKINAGLDIINALCRFHGITAPIFIDSGESINKPIPMESQIIRLVVTQDKELKIS